MMGQQQFPVAKWRIQKEFKASIKNLIVKVENVTPNSKNGKVIIKKYREDVFFFFLRVNCNISIYRPHK